jgi:hypothetical protein
VIVKNKYCIFQYAKNKLPPSGTGSTKKRKDGMNKQWQASSACASAHVRNKPWLGWKTTLRLEATSSSLKLVSTICKGNTSQNIEREIDKLPRLSLIQI